MTQPAPTAAELGIRSRDVDQLCVDTIRMLAVDMVNAADSGHPADNTVASAKIPTAERSATTCLSDSPH